QRTPRAHPKGHARSSTVKNGSPATVAGVPAPNTRSSVTAGCGTSRSCVTSRTPNPAMVTPATPLDHSRRATSHSAQSARSPPANGIFECYARQPTGTFVQDTGAHQPQVRDQTERCVPAQPNTEIRRGGTVGRRNLTGRLPDPVPGTADWRGTGPARRHTCH